MGWAMTSAPLKRYETFIDPEVLKAINRKITGAMIFGLGMGALTGWMARMMWEATHRLPLF